MLDDLELREQELRNSVAALRQIVSLYDEVGLHLPAAHAATTLDAVIAALDELDLGSIPLVDGI